MLNKQHGKKNVIHSILGKFKLAQTYKQEAVGEATHIQTHVPSTLEAIAAMEIGAPSLSRLIYVSQPSD